jgi:hypothetical protein
MQAAAKVRPASNLDITSAPSSCPGNASISLGRHPILFIEKLSPGCAASLAVINAGCFLLGGMNYSRLISCPLAEL